MCLLALLTEIVIAEQDSLLMVSTVPCLSKCTLAQKLRQAAKNNIIFLV